MNTETDNDHDDGEWMTEEGSTGPGRGRLMTELPKHSVYTLLPADKREQVIRWAIGSVRSPEIVEDMRQAILFAFMRCAIPAGTTRREIENKARTVAKRWALDEKRMLSMPVTLSRPQYFDKEARDSCKRASAEFGFDDAALAASEGELVDMAAETAGDEGLQIDLTRLPAAVSQVIDRLWFALPDRVTNVVRHLMMGESTERAAELEAITVGTAQMRVQLFVDSIRAAL